MDNQQFNFDWNSADLADFGANLSANLSTGLSISDSIQVRANPLRTNGARCMLLNCTFFFTYSKD